MTLVVGCSSTAKIQNSDDLFLVAKNRKIPSGSQLRFEQYGVQGLRFLLTENSIEIQIKNTLIDRDFIDFQLSSDLCKSKSEKITLNSSSKNVETFILTDCKTYLTEMKNLISEKISEVKNFEIPLNISYIDSSTNNVVTSSGVLKITLTYVRNVK